MNPSIIESSFSSIPNINWDLLSVANHYYANRGFEYMEVPYIVPSEYNELTKPHNDICMQLSNGMFNDQHQELIGSGEQGFIYLLAQGKLTKQKLFTITPCFRKEHYDNLHYPWFMKLELFYLSNNLSDTIYLLELAFKFFSNHTKENNLEIVQITPSSWDINLNGIEIGSYGLRKFEFGSYIYGTGLALPRFDIANNHDKI